MLIPQQILVIIAIKPLLRPRLIRAATLVLEEHIQTALLVYQEHTSTKKPKPAYTRVRVDGGLIFLL